ncbi:hypothetical protein Tco_1401323 [Tanacetum coccineum]
MLERGSYIPWASRFRRYLNRKRDNWKWLLKALDEGPYVFKIFTPEGSTIPRLQTIEDLEGDDLLLYDAEMEVMNMILLSIPNEIYNSVDACTLDKDILQPEWLKYVSQVCLAKQLTVDSFDDLFDYLQQFEKLDNASRAKKLEKSHDPLALVAQRVHIQTKIILYGLPSSVLIMLISAAYHNSDDGQAMCTIGDEQINSNIKFNSFKGNVNSGSVEKDTHVPDLCAIEKLARNAYQEAEKQQIFAQKVQKQNRHLTSQLEMYKERVWILENINKNNNYLNEFLEADERANVIINKLSLN